MFGKKINQDVTDLNGRVQQDKNAVNLDDQIADLSGDVGKLDLPNKKSKKKSNSDDRVVKKKKKKEFFLVTMFKKIGNGFRILLGIKKPEDEIPETSQDSIPYRRVYVNGIIEGEKGVFTKCYRLEDTNFRTARQDIQDEMYLAYGDLINYFTPDIRAQIVVFNKALDIEDFKKNTLYKPSKSTSPEIRNEMNRLLVEKITEGTNNIHQEKYLVVSVVADNIEVANGTFSRVDGELSGRIKAINDCNTDPMTLDERLELLYNIYNQDADEPFFRRMEINGEEATSFNLSWMQQLGLSTKDLVAPDNMSFKDDYFKINDTYGRCLYLRNLPTRLSAEVLSDISNAPCNAITSVHLKPILQDEAIKLVRNQMLEVTRNMSSAAKKSASKGLSAEFISPDLAQEKKDSEKFYSNITEDNQKAFLMTVVVTVFADDLEDLDKFTNIVKNNADKHMCVLSKLSCQQENGFASCIPVGVNKIWADRLVDTVSAALFIPFESLELVQKDGLFYGLNDKKNMIFYDRRTAQNSNGLILGIPGSGKSMEAKSEMNQVFLRDDKNEIFVIDPQREYGPLCRSHNGQIIKIAPNTKTYINPFDMDVSPEANENNDPIRVKSSYICSVCETVIGGEGGLNPIHTTIIDRVVRKIYEPYIEHMDTIRRNGSTVSCDPSKCPTFVDFYDELGRQPEPEAEYIRLAMEKYCIGSYDTFAHHTNIETNNRFVVYDIKDIGTGLMEMGMQVVLNDIWNRCIFNKTRNVRTWIYIDEMYLLTASASCSKFLNYIWRQVRKFGGVPTGISHQVTDFYKNKDAQVLLDNSPFLVLLNQQKDDRDQIGAKLGISDAQLDYIKNAESGTGLICTGKAVLPFDNRYPKDNYVYKLISTNPNEETALSQKAAADTAKVS